MRTIKIFRLENHYGEPDYTFDEMDYHISFSGGNFSIYKNNDTVNPIYPVFIGSLRNFYIKINENGK